MAIYRYKIKNKRFDHKFKLIIFIACCMWVAFSASSSSSILLLQNFFLSHILCDGIVKLLYDIMWLQNVLFFLHYFYLLAMWNCVWSHHTLSPVSKFTAIRASLLYCCIQTIIFKYDVKLLGNIANILCFVYGIFVWKYNKPTRTKFIACNPYNNNDVLAMLLLCALGSRIYNYAQHIFA